MTWTEEEFENLILKSWMQTLHEREERKRKVVQKAVQFVFYTLCAVVLAAIVLFPYA